MKGINASKLDTQTADKLIESGLDVTAPVLVDVTVNRTSKTIHLNVNGICVLRACRIDTLQVDGRIQWRKKE